MQALRNAALLTRFVLVWFALSIGVAVASPVFKPQAMELVCSGGGAMKLLLKDADGEAGASGVTLDCPLCASLAPPPVPFEAVSVQPVAPAAWLPHADPAALAGAAPPPARGPPLVFAS